MRNGLGDRPARCRPAQAGRRARTWAESTVYSTFPASPAPPCGATKVLP
jgi:hypothetical protein